MRFSADFTELHGLRGVEHGYYPNMGSYEGIVVASYGRGALIARDDPASALEHCALPHRRLHTVCGDRVRCAARDGADFPLLESVLARRNVIERMDQNGRAEAVAANIDRLAVIAAPLPAPDWFVVDRYVAAARFIGVPTLLVLNKIDLGWDAERLEFECYHAVVERCIAVSAMQGAGIADLQAAVAMGTTLFVGQSGVGKSTLLNALVTDAAAQTAALTREAEGRHTTSTARRYALASNAAIIDAPGVRDFAPPPRDGSRDAQRGFADIEAASVRCRFRDCRHFDEPDCAVRAAVEVAAVSPRRYESYRRLVRLYERIAERRY
jgi:ribosome biogenesis GTPase / thiamine phosphate phosphatase